MKNQSKMLKKYRAPFSDKAKKLALKFDSAIIAQDTEKLKSLFDDAESILKEENVASKAMIYYSLGTAHSDLARLIGDQTETVLQKVLYYFRKSINLIEQDEYKKDIYHPYVLALKEILYTNYANALDCCGRKIAAIEQYKKVLSFNSNFGMALGNLGQVYQPCQQSISLSVRAVVLFCNGIKHILCINPLLTRNKTFVPGNRDNPFRNRLCRH